jgi:hypothetical protein
MTETSRPPAPSYRTAAGVTAGVLALYLLTLAPTIGLWDAGEYTTAAAGLGIPHPPGNPGYLLVGRVVTLLPFASTIAVRLNIFVALASALSSGLWFLVAEQIARSWLTRERARIAAVVCALLGATAFTVWNQSVVNEKVYTISLFLLVLDVWTAIRWQQQPDGPRADRRLALICYRLGLGYTVHIAGLLAGPAVLAAVVSTRAHTLRRGRLMTLCAALFVLGLTPFSMLPIRAAFRLGINEGHPTACEDGRPHWSCTVSARTLDRFLYAHNRTQYAKPSVLERQETMSHQVRMWWLYFKWQWLRDTTGAAPGAQSALAILMLMLAGAGAWAHWRHDRRSFAPFATLIATLTAGLVYYLNFRLGFSQAVAMGVSDPAAMEVRDRDYFFLWSYSALAVWIGLGLAYLWQFVAEYIGAADVSDDPWAGLRRWRWHLASLVFCIALVPLVANGKWASRRHETLAEDFAVDLLDSVEPNAILFTGGDNDSFPLWYAQQVLGIRRDVSVVLTSYLAADWYARELITRTPEPYDAAHGPAVYRSMPAAAPAHAVLTLSRERADEIPPVTRLAAPQHVQLPGFTVDVPAGEIDRELLIMLRIMQDAGTRPIYFSRGAGSPAIDTYFKPHLVTQGLARKMVPSVSDDSGVVVTKREGPVDVARTQVLWDHFRGRTALRRNGQWGDAASASMPYLYLRLGVALADAQDSVGNHPLGKSIRTDVFELGQSLDFTRYLRAGRALDAPAGLGYAPVTGR